MAFEGKAKADEKAQHTREYVSILKRLSTQPSSVRWGFEMASKVVLIMIFLYARRIGPKISKRRAAG
jgi:hypothetical protein